MVDLKLLFRSEIGAMLFENGDIDRFGPKTLPNAQNNLFLALQCIVDA